MIYERHNANGVVVGDHQTFVDQGHVDIKGTCVVEDEPELVK